MSAKSIHILVATGIFPPSVGGPATYSKLLADELPKRGIPVTVVSFDTVRKYPKVIRHIFYIILLFRKTRGVTHIYAQDPVSVGLPALFVSFVTRKKFWIKVVGDFAWEQGVQRYGVKDLLDEFSVKNDTYPLYVKFLKRIQVFVVNRAEFVITPSEYLRKIITNWGVDQKKIFVIYNGFSGISSDIKDKESVRKELKLSGSIVFSAGRLVPWKGFSTLIHLMPDLLTKFPDLHLYIAGEGPQKKELELLVVRLEISEYVTFLGPLSKSLLHKHMKASDLFVLNTAYEGFSHILLESLALGLPIVTTKVGGNPEMIKDHSNGKLVPYNNPRSLSEAIEEMLSHDDLMSLYAKRGKSVVNKFTQENMLENFINFVRKHAVN